jgi:acetyl-CoA/propionyl-CoA carboxylase biotin carboxyl carrier protein
MAWGEDREEARHRMLRALGEFDIEGIPTTIPFHQWVLKTPEFGQATHTTTWVEEALAENPLGPADGAPHVPLISPQAPAKGAQAAEILVEVNGRRVPVRVYDSRLETAPRPPAEHHTKHGEHVHNVVAAPMQGTILKVSTEQGADIAAGDVICVLEAMKMENHITANRDGTVTDLPITVGQVVEIGATLAIID